MRADIGPVLGGLLLLVAGCAGVPVQPEPPAKLAIEAQASGISQQDIAREAARLQAALQQEVPQHTIDTTAGDLAWISRAKAAVAAGPLAIEQPQLLVVVDRDPAVQELRIILAQPDASGRSSAAARYRPVSQGGVATSSRRWACSCIPTASSTTALSAHTTRTTSAGLASKECASGISAGRPPKGLAR